MKKRLLLIPVFLILSSFASSAYCETHNKSGMWCKDFEFPDNHTTGWSGANFKFVYEGDVPANEFTKDNFFIGEKQFITEDLEYLGADTSLAYQLSDKSLWKAKISYDGQVYDIFAEQTIRLDDYVSVTFKPNGRVINGQIDTFTNVFLFRIDTSFLMISQPSLNTVEIINSYTKIDGLIEVFETNQVIGNTIAYTDYHKPFLVGTNTHTLDIVNINTNKVKIRQYIRIITDYEYTPIQGKYASQFKEVKNKEGQIEATMEIIEVPPRVVIDKPLWLEILDIIGDFVLFWR
jgi:hypothetical protein